VSLFFSKDRSITKERRDENTKTDDIEVAIFWSYTCLMDYNIVLIGLN
jgi:hypothetical protein